MRPLAFVALVLIALAPTPLVAQRPDSLAADVRQYTVVDTAVVALTHVLLVDGTGAPPKPDQTVVIRDGRIADVGPAAAVQVPPGARSMDLSGSTVIPGIVGMHDHLFYTAAGGWQHGGRELPRGCPPVRGVLGFGGSDLDQSVRRHPPRRAGRGHCGGA